MPGIKTRSEVLSIRLSVETIVGCYDIHDLMGESTINKAMATVIADAITTLIGVMCAEGKLPQYTDQEALLDRLHGLLDEPDQRTIDTPTLQADPAEVSGRDFAELVNAVASNVVEDPIAQGDMEVSGLGEVDIDIPQLTFADIKAANPEDKLVKVCEGDELKERALVDVYTNIPTNRRGTDTAAKLLTTALKIMGEAVNETEVSHEEETP